MNNKKYFAEGIYVDREYCKETEEKCRVLHPYLKAARHLPRYQLKWRLEGAELVLHGISYTAETLHRLPDDLKGPAISSKSDSKTFRFFSSLNPLSNFHPATFSLNGCNYSSSEQMIQHKKAEYFGDDETA